MFKRVCVALFVALFLCGGSALAYDGFTVGVHAEAHSLKTSGYGVHVVAPLFGFSHGTGPMVSVRGDFSASAVPFLGVSGVISGTAPNLQPFAAFGGGVDFVGAGRPTAQFLGMLGVRARVYDNLFLYTHGHLRIGRAALVGIALGLEYSF